MNHEVGTLPRTVLVNGREYRVRTDFRDILRILAAFNDPELEDAEKVYVCLHNFYEDFDRLPRQDYEAAYLASIQFMDNGTEETSGRKPPRVMDWEQDEVILFPAINKVAGFETRSARYIHWWTFMGYYMEISEGIYHNVLQLRLKKARGKKLEKWEQEFWNANKSQCVLRTRLTEEERAARDRLNAMLG